MFNKKEDVLDLATCLHHLRDWTDKSKERHQSKQFILPIENNIML